MHIPKSALAAVCALAPVAEKVEVAERTPSHSVAQPGRRDENAVDDAHDERPESHIPPIVIESRPAAEVPVPSGWQAMDPTVPKRPFRPQPQSVFESPIALLHSATQG